VVYPVVDPREVDSVDKGFSFHLKSLWLFYYYRHIAFLVSRPSGVVSSLKKIFASRPKTSIKSWFVGFALSLRKRKVSMTSIPITFDHNRVHTEAYSGARRSLFLSRIAFCICSSRFLLWTITLAPCLCSLERARFFSLIVSNFCSSSNVISFKLLFNINEFFRVKKR